MRRSFKARRFGLGLCLSAAMMISAAQASAEPGARQDQPLADAAQEARAKTLFQDVRCVVCQHESIADSPAGIAADMRALVREQIAAGRTEAEIRQDLVRRYGDYVLFTPPVRQGTWLLWFGPFALVILAGGVLIVRSRRPRAEVAPLTEEEVAELEALVAEAPSDKPEA